MSAQRNIREKVWAVKNGARKSDLKAMITAPASAVAATLICLGLVSVAQGAAETKLKEANTSIGVLPTSVTNEWKLITDPAITTPAPVDNTVDETFDPSQYYVIGGSLDNTYDASKYHLLQDPTTDTYATGVSVEGVLPYEVTGFDVLMNGGGNVDVQVNPTDPAVDTVTKTGDTSDGELGEVDDITFALIGDLRGMAKTSDMDQDFFDLVLVDNEGTAPPTTGTAFGGPDSFITLGPINPANPNVDITDINPSGLPEPASAALMLFGAGFMGLRRRKS
ncbi:MAG: PEP-CTERM sorting domain-containing protein [Tepidisphaeraceae bacterium]